MNEISTYKIESTTLTPPEIKYKLERLLYWAEVIRSNPVVLSETAPVAALYFFKASEAIRIRVVPW